MGVVVSDPSLIQSALHDVGNSKAVVTIQAKGFGTASIAAYAVSNPAIISYAAGNLIKRQAVYVSDPISYNALTLSWYIPEA